MRTAGERQHWFAFDDHISHTVWDGSLFDVPSGSETVRFSPCSMRSTPSVSRSAYLYDTGKAPSGAGTCATCHMTHVMRREGYDFHSDSQRPV